MENTANPSSIVAYLYKDGDQRSSGQAANEFDELEGLDFLDGDQSEWNGKMDEAAFHGLAGDIVRMVEPHSEADPAALLINILVMYGNSAGREPHFSAGGAKHHMNLYANIVGKSFEGRKGSSLAPILKIMHEADPDFYKRHHSGLSSGEGLISFVRDRKTKMEPVFEGKGKNKKHTGEYVEVIVDEGVSDKRALVVESEFSRVLNVMRREGNTLSAILRDAWDGKKRLGNMTKDPTTATDAHISIIGHITPEELKSRMSRDEVTNGFANRFLWAYSKASKWLPSGGELHKVNLEFLIKRLQRSLAFAENELPKDASGNVLPMERDEAANYVWNNIYERLQGDLPGTMGVIISRVIPYLMRLACIYALLDCSHVVRLEHLRAALAVWKYCYKSVLFIFGDHEVVHDPIAVRIIEELKKGNSMSFTDVSNLFQRHISAKELQIAVRKMQENGLVVLTQVPGKGRPKTMIELNELA